MNKEIINIEQDVDITTAKKGFIQFIVLIIAFIAIISFRKYVVERVIVNGNSMYPTYHNQDVLWTQKFNVTDNLQRGQIVTAKVGTMTVIKRVIGLPHETVQMKEGKIYINDVLLEESYCDKAEDPGVLKNSITLKEDEYLVLGDNRNHSVDCRVWGPIKKEDITGKVILKIFPFWK